MIELIRQKLLPLNNSREIQEHLKCAAVLIPLIYNTTQSHWEVIFTQRAQHLKHHPGQISFPGGGHEHQDGNLSDTALRETFEEIGIKKRSIELLGQLPQQETVSKYNVTPIVGIVNSEHYFKADRLNMNKLIIDSNEVADIFTAPLNFVMAPENQNKKTQTINGTKYSFYVIQYQDYNIWGATAKILVNLTRLITSST